MPSFRKTHRFLFSKAFLGLALVCFTSTALAQSFVHPGGLHNQTDLDRMKAKVAAGESPWIEGWNRLVADTTNLLNYNPTATANMGNSRQNASRDAHRAYEAFIRWYVSGDTAYAEKAVQICNAWSAVVNQVPTGVDIPGLSGIPIAEFAMVGELLRIYPGWAQADFERFKNMMLTYWYPVCRNFLLNHNNACISNYWANWDASNIMAIMAIGILCDDEEKFNEAISYYLTGPGMGSLTHAVYALHPGDPDRPYGLGQWQESGRDQNHAQLGVGFLASVCEMAWKQGVDLYGTSNNRLLAGAEYVAQTQLWLPVPYDYYNNCSNANQSWVAFDGRGRLDDRPLWEMIYNHYVVRQGLNAPMVKAMAELMRPEHGSVDHFGYGTLTFTLEAVKSPHPAFPVAPAPTNVVATAGVSRVMLSWEASSPTTTQGYRVQRATSPGGPFTTISTITNNTTPAYTNTGLTNGTTYYYQVAAINQAGTSDNSAVMSATPLAAGALPPGWTHSAIGSTGGSASYASVSNDTFIVAGNGTDIGGTADSFSYAYTSVTGNATITGRLLINGTIKVGLMMRESTAANARMVTMTVGEVGGRQGRFRTRATAGANTSTQIGNDYTRMPAWFRLQRSGNSFTAFESADGITWFQVGSSTTVAMAETYFVGLAVCASTATFDNVTIVGSGHPPTAPAGLIATGGEGQVSLSWAASAGSIGYNVKRAAVSGGPYTTVATDVTSLSFTDTGLADNTTYYYVVSAVNAGGESGDSAEAEATTLIPGMAPPVITSPASAGGVIGSFFHYAITATNSPTGFSASSLPAGLALDTATGVISGTPTAATTTTVTIGATNDFGTGTASLSLTIAPAPTPWASQDIGSGVTPAGSLTIDEATGTFTVMGAGGDIGGAADSLHYAYRSLTGNFTIEARLASLTLGGPINDKVGIMIREGLAANARMVNLFLDTSNPRRARFAFRPSAGANTNNIDGPSMSEPLWFRLVRSGTMFSGYVSTDGVNYTLVHSATVAMTTSNPIFVGLSVCSRNNGSLNTSVFTHVSIAFAPPSIMSAEFANGTYGAPFSYSIVATNTPSSFNATGLPAGLTVNSVSGVISGLPTVTGAFDVVLGAVNAAGSGTAPLALEIAAAPATVTLGDLTQIYDGAEKVVAVSTEPEGLAFHLSYDGASVPPVNAGNYEVVATVDDPNYTGSATDTLTISPASAGVILGNLAHTYDGTPKAASATTNPAGLNVLLSYDGDTAAPVNARSYGVIAVVSDQNYSGAASGTLAIGQAGASITFGDLVQRYDGEPRPVSVTTSPTGLSVEVTYDGAAEPPVYPGSYEVVATIDDPNHAGAASETLAIGITALVRHGFTLNGNSQLDGSAQILLGTNTTLNGNAMVSGDLLAPGVPTLVRNGQALHAGIIDGPGAETPTGYTVTLNGNVVLRYLVRRIDPLDLPEVAAPPAPAGTRAVALTAPGQSPGDFATLRNLTLAGNAGLVAVPPGTYGNLSASGNSGFVLGVEGASEPAVYNLQNLSLNALPGVAQLRVVGPVVITLANGALINGNTGSAEHPDWLTLRFASGGLTSNGTSVVHARVIAPHGTVTLNGTATLRGSLVADKLVINGNSKLTEPDL